MKKAMTHALSFTKETVSLREGDDTFGTVSSFHAVDQFITDILDGSPRPLALKLLARAYVRWRTGSTAPFSCGGCGRGLYNGWMFDESDGAFFLTSV